MDKLTVFLNRITGVESVFAPDISAFAMAFNRFTILLVTAWFVFSGIVALTDIVRGLTGKSKTGLLEYAYNLLVLFNLWTFTCATLWWDPVNYMWAIVGFYVYGIVILGVMFYVMIITRETFATALHALPGMVFYYLGLTKKKPEEF